LDKREKTRLADRSFQAVTLASALVVLAIVSAIFLSLFKESYLSISHFGFFKFFTTTTWDPVREIFGAASTLYGTLVTTTISLVIAVPISLGIAIFTTEICPRIIRGPLSSGIELLAAIPSIIYGMWGLFTLAPIMADHVEPFLQNTFGGVPLIGFLFQGTPIGIDILTASIVLSIMITPFISSIARDTFLLTPQILKESAYGVGATKWEVIKDVMIPYSRLGIYGGIVIALGRALGETMAVAFVLGNKHAIATSLFDASATITVTLANEFTEADTDLYLSSLFFLALILFISSFVILALAKYMIKRMERV
jgi:phosphate transport system permease protein